MLETDQFASTSFLEIRQSSIAAQFFKADQSALQNGGTKLIMKTNPTIKNVAVQWKISPNDFAIFPPIYFTVIYKIILLTFHEEFLVPYIIEYSPLSLIILGELVSPSGLLYQ